MAMTQQGTIREGRVEFETPVNLPEGSQVFVIPSPVLDEQTACRKANVWLMMNIGQVGTKKHGEFTLTDKGPIWRFEAYISNAGTQPFGPIGLVEVDADTGHILNPSQIKTNLLAQIDQLTPHP